MADSRPPNLRPPRLRLVSHNPLWRWLLAGLAVVGCVGGLLVGYAVGQNALIQQRVDVDTLQRELGDTQASLQGAQSKLAEMELELQVQTAALSELRGQLKEEHAASVRLGEEVTFYKSLMAPNEVRQGLSVEELELHAGSEAGSYRFELLLTQVAVRRNVIVGVVRIDIEGETVATLEALADAGPDESGVDGQDDQEEPRFGAQTAPGAQVVKSLTDLSTPGAYPLTFRFRYFQDLRGEFVIPEGFKPLQVLVTAKEKGKPPMQVKFPWPAATGSGSSASTAG
ncbi:MAG: DUF6776 family protein [Pseudomonadota bacterium]